MRYAVSFLCVSHGSLRACAAEFDTSGDGALDENELKCALRVAIGAEVSIEDCKKLIQSLDKDGNGVVDFSEFKGIIKDKAD